MSQTDRITRARSIAAYAAQLADDNAKTTGDFYAHAGDDTGRVAAEAFREEGPDAAAEVIAAYHVAYCAAVKKAKAPTWDEQTASIGMALPPSLLDEQPDASEQIEAAMRRLNP